MRVTAVMVTPGTRQRKPLAAELQRHGFRRVETPSDPQTYRFE
jgi:hypothetical protein